MRPVRVDLTGTTDANGNATIKVPLPFTGAWYNVKFSLSTSAPAEWAVLLSGTAVTYGRGRRVTLGPELIQDGETVTINVTTGPPTAAIIGSMNGSAGMPDEMLRTYAPQPNTISVDAAAEVETLASVKGIGNVTTTGIPVPAHVNTIGYALAAAGPGGLTALSISGEQTGIVYFSHTAAQAQMGSPAQSVAYATLLDPRDTSLKLIVITNGGGFGPVDVLAWQLPAQVWARQLPGDVFTVQSSTTPPVWQAPTKLVSNTTAAVGTVAMLAGVVGQLIRVWGWELEIDNATADGTIAFIEDDTSGNPVAFISDRGTAAAVGSKEASGNHSGAGLDATGHGLRLNLVAQGGGARVRAVASVSQG